VGRKRALFASTHQMPLYPGTGDVHETGAHGNILNVPLAPATAGPRCGGLRDDDPARAGRFRARSADLVSAGFDAHAADPLANLNWRESDYMWLTQRLCDLADDTCEGRLVSASKAAMTSTRWRVLCGPCGGSDGAGGMSDKPVDELSFEEAMKALERSCRSWNGATWRWRIRSPL
jgi:hypothetical protein